MASQGCSDQFDAVLYGEIRVCDMLMLSATDMYSPSRRARELALDVNCMEKCGGTRNCNL